LWPQKANPRLWIYSEGRLEERPFLFQILPLALPFFGWRIARSMSRMTCFSAACEASMGLALYLPNFHFTAERKFAFGTDHFALVKDAPTDGFSSCVSA
jgi:hypothetical protein